jgi:flavin reductase (DIM6/NTAB) family NADH-FMN oxidoreductase RutF
VLFSNECPKDSLVFVQETGEFVCSLATFDLRSAVVATSAQFPRGVNEMKEGGGSSLPPGTPAAGRRLGAGFLRARRE